MIAIPDQLRSVTETGNADPRNLQLLHLDGAGIRNISFEDHHAEISCLRLNDSVPEQINIQFETARNLYLYSWFVYRFYPVSQQHALACLELALREVFGKTIPKRYFPKARHPMLKSLLRFAVDTGAIENQGFRRWHAHVERRARNRYETERMHEMLERGLNVIEMDYREAVPNEDDRKYDYLSILLETLPGTRNAHAHGSTMLTNQVLGTIELVCEIINQLFVYHDAEGRKTT